MKGLLRGTVIALLIAFGGASAEVATVSLAGGRVVNLGEGAVVVLPVSAPDVGANVALGEVMLRLPRTTLSEERETRLRIRVLRSASYASERDLDPDVSGTVVIGAGGQLASVDLSGVMHAVLEGVEMRGLVITAPGGRELTSADATALVSALRQGTLEVNYRRVPPPPRSARRS